jgi:ATP-dependent helicase HepA
VRRLAEELTTGGEAARAALVAALLDEFGTGRVMFRNTRAALSGFPERKVKLAPLDAANDAKIKWLAALLKKHSVDKVLLICRTRELAEKIHAQLQREINVNAGLFHEGLTLLQRDRNAAFFAEEDGARVLICSEIGSEGRNFQFAHHLVLFDLPANPELLEQRIGRLDRIGQTATIQIHVPYVRGTDGEVLARWYHEGLDAFERNPHGAAEIARQFGTEVAALCARFDTAKVEALVTATREQHRRIEKKLERGHDRLLELSSCKPEQAAATLAAIRGADEDETFADFFLRLLDHFGVAVEELAPRTWLFKPGQLITDAFPSLPEDGMSVTFDRKRALSRDDLGFMSWDHPLVRSALDLLLGAEAGNAAFGVWKTAGAESVLLEVHAVVECVAPASLHVDRFLSATPLRIVVDHALADHTDDPALAAAKLEKGDVFRLLDRGVVKKKLLPAMIEKVQTLAAERMQVLVGGATAKMEGQLRDEIERLEDLREVNDHIRPEEIAALRKERSELTAALASARLRLDALRIIFRIP